MLDYALEPVQLPVLQIYCNLDRRIGDERGKSALFLDLFGSILNVEYCTHETIIPP
jgi:hypothetical protein